MVFVIADKEVPGWTMLVKAKDEFVLKDRLKFKETERIVGTFTDNEIQILLVPDFVVITG